jgi:HlyD family secretion protein
MSAPVNLKDLAVRRDTGDGSSFAPRRHLVSRYLLPGALVTGFLALTIWSARDAWLPRQPVTVIPVHVSLSEMQTAGTPLFKAAGWIEPRPTPIRVAALAVGVVDQLLVVEDQAVKKGEPIAQLVTRDAELALEQAIATEGMRKAETDEAQAVLTAARTNLEFPTQLELPLAEADADLAVVETELTNLPNQLKRAEARLRLAQADWDAKSENRQSIQPLLVVRAQSELDASQAEVDELTQRRPALERQREALQRQRAAAAKRLELKTEETRAVSAAVAHLASFEAQWREAQSRVAAARLQLERMTIRAPVSGRILNLIANPGSQLMTGPSQMEARDSNTVVTIYQPERMQVRVDVRFEDLPRVGRDQPVQVKSPAFPEAIAGRVLFLTSFANVQKNTLAVKVALDAPPSVLKPEMLVDVTFLAPEQPKPESGDESQKPTEEYRLFLPRAVVESGTEGHFVWVADLARRVARRQPVVLGAIQTPTLLEITGGLTAASRIISAGRESLRDGDRIEIQGEDLQLGMSETDNLAPSAPPAPHASHPET